MESGTHQRGVKIGVVVLWRTVMNCCHYISLENAQLMLRARASLQDQVEHYFAQLGVPFPVAVARGTHHSVFARQLATFRFEDALFILMSERAGLTPSWLPFSADWFVTRSALKRSYVMPTFAERFGRNGGLVTTRRHIVADVERCAGKRLQEIVTSENKQLPEWHKSRLYEGFGGAHIFDESVYASTWARLSVSDRYEAFLSLFVAHMVLFEDYHGGESGGQLDDFTANTFEPAFKRVTARFGVSPLIVPVPWKPELAYYPAGELMHSWRSVPFLSD